MTLAEKINRFNKNLHLSAKLPGGVEVMNPFQEDVVYGLSRQFYNRFFSDNQPRKLLLGINPGRFGAGVTGIPFTDPVKLKENCGIQNDLKKTTEPSAGFIYDMIDAFDGPGSFYSKYLFHAVCPLGFTKKGKNYNYYDDKSLEKAVTPFIIESLRKFTGFEIETDLCFCLGNGKNYSFLQKLNDREKFFREIIPLPHPRWIVQYRRKKYDEFIRLYLDTLK